MKLNFVNTVLITYLSIASMPLLAQKNVPVNDIDPVTANNNSIFPASFFSQYTPQNAMEMIQRLPGFTFNRGSNARGFGGNAGNVLIDGVRPSSKSGGLRGALQRIPVAQVLQIEILRGGVGAGEAAGQSIVANIIKKDTQTSGTWGLELKRAPNKVYKSEIEATITMKLGKWDTLFDAEIGGYPGYRTALIEDLNANNELTSNATEILETLNERISFTSEASRELGGGKLTINTALSGNKWQGDTSRDIYTTSLINYTNKTNNTAPDEYWLLNQDEENIKTELGVDWVNVSNNWKWRVIGLASSHDHKYENTYHFEEKNSAVTDNSQYANDTLKTEYIARTTYGKVGDMKFKPEFGIEIANNQLETESDLIENNIPQQLEGADIVEELRGEVFANMVYITNPNLTVEGGLTAEISEIKVTGDVNQSQTFHFIKPRLSASYKINDLSQLTLVAERSVNQLNFSDFAASSDTTDSRTTSGNSNLQPEHANTLIAIYNLRFSERGSLKVETLYERRQDIHEKIILPSGNEGLGNAGDANFWRVETNVNLPLDAFLENGLLEIAHAYRGSDFDDPIINSSRTVSSYTPNSYRIEFRQDLSHHKFSWGLEYKSDFKDTKFYVDEIKTFEGNNRLARFFFETTQFFDIKSRLEIKNINLARYTRSRYFYQDDRSGAYEGAEIAHRKREAEVKLSFFSTF
ncbi:MAG: TonB-dependent receptor plug domain-containing protein [Colwellia sp.]